MLAHDWLNGMFIASMKMLFMVVQPWMLLLWVAENAIQFTACDGDGRYEISVVLFGGGEETVKTLQGIVLPLGCNSNEMSRFQRPIDHHDRDAEVKCQVGEGSQHGIWVDAVLGFSTRFNQQKRALSACFSTTTLMEQPT